MYVVLRAEMKGHLRFERADALVAREQVVVTRAQFALIPFQDSTFHLQDDRTKKTEI